MKSSSDMRFCLDFDYVLKPPWLPDLCHSLAENKQKNSEYYSSCCPKCNEITPLHIARFAKFLRYVWVESVVRGLSIPVCATTFFEWCASMVFLLWKDMLNLNMSDLVKKTSEAVCRRYYSDDLLYISSKKIPTRKNTNHERSTFYLFPCKRSLKSIFRFNKIITYLIQCNNLFFMLFILRGVFTNNTHF